MSTKRYWSTVTGITLIVIGGLLLLSNVTEFEVAWEWVLPGLLVLAGIGMLLARSGGGGGAPPSQFERDDAPRVP